MPMSAESAQNLLDASGADPIPPVENNPTEEQVTKEAVKEVIQAEEQQKEAREVLKQAEKEEKEKAKEAERQEALETEAEKAAREKAAKEAEEKKAAKEAEEKAKKEAEAKAEEDKKAKEKADLEVAERLGKLAARERKLLSEQAAMKKEREDFAKERSTFDEQKKAIALLEANPERALKLLGASFEKMATRALELRKNPTAAMEAELEATKASFEKRLKEEADKRDAADKARREAETAAIIEQDHQATIQTVSNVIAQGGEKYELIQARGMAKQLAEEVWSHFRETGNVPNLAEYLAHVEDQLEKIELPKLLSTSKGKKLTGGVKPAEEKPKTASADAKGKPDEDEEKDDEPHEVTVRRVRKTLTNSSGTRVAPPAKPKPAPTGDAMKDAINEGLWLMEEDERKKRYGAA